MKKFTITFIALVVLFAFSPAGLYAAKVDPAKATTPVESVEMQAIKNRISEIRAMDKSSLSRAEKKELRMELRSMNSAVAANNNGIYLSIGAIVIIILLLILLL